MFPNSISNKRSASDGGKKKKQINKNKKEKKRNKHTPFQMRLHSNSLSQPTAYILH